MKTRAFRRFEARRVFSRSWCWCCSWCLSVPGAGAGADAAGAGLGQFQSRAYPEWEMLVWLRQPVRRPFPNNRNPNPSGRRALKRGRTFAYASRVECVMQIKCQIRSRVEFGSNRIEEVVRSNQREAGNARQGRAGAFRRLSRIKFLVPDRLPESAVPSARSQRNLQILLDAALEILDTDGR